MSLANLIRKREPATLANDNPANFAKDAQARQQPLAKLAALALANPAGEKPAKPAIVGNTASRWWLIRFAERNSLELVCCPDATRDQILQWHPDAIAAEPFSPPIRQPFEPLSGDEEKAVRAWLARIKETDPLIIAEVVSQCQRDANARGFFTEQSRREN